MPQSSNDKPLNQRRILVTRAADQSERLEELLRELGAEPVAVPLIKFRRIVDENEAASKLEQLQEFDWILFTSSNAIRYFFELLGSRSIPEFIKLACVGSKTASKLREFGYEPHFVPSKFSSRQLALEIDLKKGEKILYPSPKEISSDLDSSLESAGATVTRWPIYETLQVDIRREDLESTYADIDAVTFASPSVISSYCKQIPEYQTTLKNTVTACIGPMTSRRADEMGVRVDVIPEEYTVEGMVEALKTHFQERERGGSHA